MGAVKTGRYPFGIALSSDSKRLYVTNVGIFQYTHPDPANPIGDSNADYPLCYPVAGYPNETENDRTIQIHKVDPRNLPTTLSVPDGIQCGYISKDQSFTAPGLGPVNAPESSSVYVFDVSKPAQPSVLQVARTGLQSRTGYRRMARVTRMPWPSVRAGCTSPTATTIPCRS